MSIDEQKMKEAYGEVNPADILSGVQNPPAEFQPLYGELNRIVNRVERPSANPARVSASLERFSAGVDPERVLVCNYGSVMREMVSPQVHEHLSLSLFLSLFANLWVSWIYRSNL